MSSAILSDGMGDSDTRVTGRVTVTPEGGGVGDGCVTVSHPKPVGCAQVTGKKFFRGVKREMMRDADGERETVCVCVQVGRG